MYMKRILSLLCAMVLVFTMVPVVSFAAVTRTVYWDPVSGADTKDGLTETAPVQTVEAAYKALEGADAGHIILLSTATFAEQVIFPTCSIPVTITAKNSAHGFTTGNHIFFSGDTTLDNMTLTLTKTSNAIYLSSEGHDLTIGAKVTTKSTDGTSRFCLTTRHGEGSMDGATLTVNSGNWRSIFYAGYTKATSGDCTLIMNGGNVNNIVGPTYSGTVTGNPTVFINGGTINVFDPGANTTGSVKGNVTITLRGGTYTKVRPQSARPITGNVTMTIDGDCTGIKAFENKSGSVAKKTLILKSGILDTAPGNFTEILLAIPKDETFTLQGCTVNATSVDSEGTLLFTGSGVLTASSVSGTLNCNITDSPLEGHAYVKAPAGSAVVFDPMTNVKEIEGVWQLSGDFNTAAFKGLVLTTTADDVVIELYKNFSTSASNLLTPVHVEGRSQYYTVTAGSRYYCISKPTSGSGRYILHKTVYITEEEATQKQIMDVTPGVRTTAGWDTSNAINSFNDEVLANARPSDASLWPQYAEIFTTPAFQPGRNDHRQTTQTEMEDFIAGLDDPDDNIYVYTLGQSAMKSFNIPIVIVTDADLSGCETWEEAAEVIRANSEEKGKVTVYYQAQIHGNEPAAGEAAFGMIKRLDGQYGETLLDKLNIYVIPRLNPYGAYASVRGTYNDSDSYTDPNRDFLHLHTAEVQARMRAFNAFEPEIVFDNHEYQFNLTNTSTTRTDMMVCCHSLPVSGEAYNKTAVDIAYASFEQLKKDGLSYSWYSESSTGTLGALGGNTGSSNTAVRGTFHILMETMGSNFGRNMYERRVASHASAVTGILNYLHANATDVKSVIKAERERIIEDGKTYREDDIFAMAVTTVDAPQYYIEGEKVNLVTGEIIPTTLPAKVTDTILRSRIAPTAYVIPADLSNIGDILNLMDMQGISYRYIPEGATLPLQQYVGTVEAADLAAEKTVTFRSGAYVFTMAQVDAQILGMYMEVDVDYAAEQKGSLAQQGMIVPANGKFPIYRYIHDLNEENFVDYTIEALRPIEVTVYVDGTNGADTNDGLTANTPVKTLEQAYALMEGELAQSAKGSSGTVVIIGMYNLGNQPYALPAATFPVTITGLTAEDGIRYTGASVSAPINRSISLNGETTFEYLTLFADSGYTHNIIVANGHKLTIGEGVNSICREGKTYYFAIYGGAYNEGDVVESTDVTIRSGTWRGVYVGGYDSIVTGTAKLDISGATVYDSIHASRMGNIGKVEMKISNTTVLTGAIYAGSMTAHSPKKLGNVYEGVTITLGENVVAPALYCSAKTYGGITGGVTVTVDGADLTKVPISARYTGLSASYSTDWSKIVLADHMVTDAAFDPAVELDLNGFDITGNLTVDGTLTVYDSATDDYDVSDGKYGEITGTVSGTLAAKDGYIAASGGFHKFGGQYISGVSLRPRNAGIYYTATVLADEVLMAELEAGVAVSLADMPGSDFETDADTLYAKGNHGVLVQNILKGDAEDADRAIMDIYAAAYVKLPDGTVLVSENDVAYSLFDILMILKEQNTEAFQSFCSAYAIENWF